MLSPVCPQCHKNLNVKNCSDGEPMLDIEPGKVLLLCCNCDSILTLHADSTWQVASEGVLAELPEQAHQLLHLAERIRFLQKVRMN